MTITPARPGVAPPDEQRRARPLPGLATAVAAVGAVGAGARPRTAWLGLDDAFRVAPDLEDAAGPPVLVHDRQALVGPIPSGSGTACPTCLGRRWQAVRPETLRTALELGHGARHGVDEPWANPFADLTVASLAALVGPRAGALHAEVHDVDLERLHVARHAVVADPECQTCGALPEDAPWQPELAASPKTAPDSYRGRSIFDYDLDLDAYANPVCGALGPGIVRDVTSTTTSATVGCLMVRSAEYLRETFWGGHDDRFDVSARIGVLEGLERAAGMRPRGVTTAVTASYHELAGADGAGALDPRTCGLYDDAFHAEHPWIHRFDPDRPIRWVWAHSLRDDRPVLVPEVQAYYHIPGQENRFVQESSSGCATGASQVEAIWFGLLEVLERDAFLLGWYGGRPLPEIDVSSSANLSTRATVERLALHGYRARFFDARVTFPVPVVIGVAERVDGGMGRLCFGAGASLDPEVAIEGALCEIATDAPNSQLRCTNHEPRLRAMVDDFAHVQSLHDHPLLHGIPEMRGYSDFLLAEQPTSTVHQRFEVDRPRPRPSLDLRADLGTVLDLVTDAGFDVLVVDQTMPEQRALGLHTVSVLVPGLLPLDFGWSRQRARSQPRMLTARHRAGLDDRDLTPEELTPAPHPLP
ncbi:TOMM precursor leader peptide-binding protein [Nocardioides sp. 1609]|uniref:TOMM precursor leader peptide-binding protein n=1 Tax=Nocardioides sp. 1609 TaxID=2508327 RepID=UPI00106F96A5|nr:TOMM precursor leader peptide-binding protein [Nocardioides sp. 1609]